MSLDLAPEGPPEPPEEASTRDVSMGGVAVFSPRPLLPGTRLRLEFQVDDAGNGGDQVRAQGEVRWSRLGAPPVLLGVEFLHFERGRETLRHWLDHRVEAG